MYILGVFWLGYTLQVSNIFVELPFVLDFSSMCKQQLKWRLATMIIAITPFWINELEKICNSVHYMYHR